MNGSFETFDGVGRGGAADPVLPVRVLYVALPRFFHVRTGNDVMEQAHFIAFQPFLPDRIDFQLFRLLPDELQGFLPFFRIGFLCFLQYGQEFFLQIGRYPFGAEHIAGQGCLDDEGIDEIAVFVLAQGFTVNIGHVPFGRFTPGHRFQCTDEKIEEIISRFPDQAGLEGFAQFIFFKCVFYTICIIAKICGSAKYFRIRVDFYVLRCFCNFYQLF